jgi:hypothetical protein
MRWTRLPTLALATTLVAALPAAPASAGPDHRSLGRAPVTFALIGDTPYGDAQRAQFPALVDDGA